jgi:luciferase family oxidoreductase group 1
VTKHDFPRVSVLETTPIDHGDTLSTALRWSVALAQLADELGYRRFWVTEYHAATDSGCSTPAVFIAHLASVTKQISVGAGGVMLPNHPPLIVAEEFRMLAALFPGRIDLGIGRGSGIEDEARPALRREEVDEVIYVRQIEELRGFLRGDFPSGHRFDRVQLPRTDALPSLYLLGAGTSSAGLAGSLGLPLTFAYYQDPELAPSAIAAYRRAFDVARFGGAPHVIPSVKVVGRDTDAEAMAAAVRTTLLRLRKAAISVAGLTVDDTVVLDPTITEVERPLVERQLALGDAVVGSPRTLRARLSELAHRLNVDEIMVVPTEYAGAGRMETLRAVAAAGLLDAATDAEAVEGASLSWRNVAR